MSSKFLAALCGALVLSVGVASAQAAPAQAKEKKLTPGTYAHFVTTEGEVAARLFDKEAPKTVANFAGLAEGTIDPATGKPGKSKPFYNGLTFHRVIPHFVVQGGCPKGDGTGGPGYTIKCEINPNRHQRGSLSMAHAGKDTGGSQFFICHDPQPHLDGVHTAFGRVVEGVEVVDKIAKGDHMIKLTPIA